MIRTIQSVVLGNDVTLEYAESGDPKGVPVICLHGVTDSYRSFDPIMPFMPAGFRVIAISQRGHGHSSRPLGGYRYVDLSTDVHRFMNALHISSAVIVGHSMGSLVAQRFAIDHPSRTLGVVLAASFLTVHGDTGVEEFWQSTLSTLNDPIDRAVAEDFQRSTICKPISPALLDLFIEESLKVPAHVWRSLFREFLDTDFSGELPRIQVPLLMLWGDQDAYCGAAHWDGLRRAIPHAESKLYQGIGHALHWEAPERFASDVVSFVQQQCLHHAI